MPLRTSREAVTFARPFSLRGVDGVHPPGTYTVETDEELIDGLSFPAYRRVATVIFLPSRPGGTVDGRMASVDPRELRTALERDALPTQIVGDHTLEAEGRGEVLRRIGS